MPILNRLSTLLFADVHAVLDKLEDPHTSLNLSVREMEACLVQTDQDISELSARLEKLQRQGVDIAQRISGFDDELDVCFSSNEETLAKMVLRKKLVSENTLTSTTKTIDEVEQALENQRALYRENERRLISMREKLELYFNDVVADCENFDGAYGSHDTVNEEAVEVAFLREKQRRDV